MLEHVGFRTDRFVVDPNVDRITFTLVEPFAIEFENELIPLDANRHLGQEIDRFGDGHVPLALHMPVIVEIVEVELDRLVVDVFGLKSFGREIDRVVVGPNVDVTVGEYLLLIIPIPQTASQANRTEGHDDCPAGIREGSSVHNGTVPAPPIDPHGSRHETIGFVIRPM